MITTIADFKGTYQIVNISDPNKALLFTELIAELEPQILSQIIGVETPDDDDLKELLKSVIVRYVYWNWRAKSVISQNESGAMATNQENGVTIPIVFTLNEIWNDMNDKIELVWKYCSDNNISIKPTFDIIYASWL